MVTRPKEASVSYENCLPSSAPRQLKVALDRGHVITDYLYVWSIAARVVDRLVLPLLLPTGDTCAPQLPSFPSELMAQVATYLDARDLLRLGGCSRAMGDVASRDWLWSPLLLRLLETTRLSVLPAAPADLPPKHEYRWRAERMVQLRRVGRARMLRAYATRFEPWVHPPHIPRRRIVFPRGIAAPPLLAPFGRRSSTGSLVPDLGAPPSLLRSDDIFGDPGNLWDW